MELLVILFYQAYTDKNGNKKTFVQFGTNSLYNGTGEYGIRYKCRGILDGHRTFELYNKEYKCKTRTFEDGPVVVEVIE